MEVHCLPWLQPFFSASCSPVFGAFAGLRAIVWAQEVDSVKDAEERRGEVESTKTAEVDEKKVSEGEMLEAPRCPHEDKCCRPELSETSTEDTKSPTEAELSETSTEASTDAPEMDPDDPSVIDSESPTKVTLLPRPSLFEEVPSPSAPQSRPSAWGAREKVFSRRPSGEASAEATQATVCVPPSHGYRISDPLPQRRRKRPDAEPTGSSKQFDGVPAGVDGGATASSVASEPLHWDPNSSLSHGWTKQHKSSRNTKLQQKVAYQTQKRAEQSRQSRGFLCDED